MTRPVFGSAKRLSCAPCSQFCTLHAPFAHAQIFCRASDERPSGGSEGKQSDSPAISEDILAKLRQYEEENKKLKEKLDDKVGA